MPIGLAIFAALCIALCIFLTRQGLIFSHCQTTDVEANDVEATDGEATDVETTNVEATVESTPTSVTHGLLLQSRAHRSHQPGVSAQRGIPGGEETAVEEQEQAVRIHCENKSTERYMYMYPTLILK